MKNNKPYIVYAGDDGKEALNTAIKEQIETEQLLYTRPEEYTLPAGYLVTKDCPWYVKLIRHIF